MRPRFSINDIPNCVIRNIEFLRNFAIANPPMQVSYLKNVFFGKFSHGVSLSNRVCSILDSVSIIILRISKVKMFRPNTGSVSTFMKNIKTILNFSVSENPRGSMGGDSSSSVCEFPITIHTQASSPNPTGISLFNTFRKSLFKPALDTARRVFSRYAFAIDTHFNWLVSEKKTSAIKTSFSKARGFTVNARNGFLVGFCRILSHGKLILSCAIPRKVNALAGFFITLIIANSTFVLAETTERLGLNLPEFQAPRWDIPLNQNWDIIDSSVALLSSSNTFTGSTTFTTGNFNTVKISTANYSGTEKLVVNGTVKLFGPTGSVLSLCDSDGINCTNLSVTNPVFGVVVSTMTFDQIQFNSRQQSVVIGNGAAGAYVGHPAGRPSVVVGPGALSDLVGTEEINGASGGHTAVGYGSLDSLIYGIQNTSVGDFSCAYLTTGSHNMCFGYGAGHGEGGNNVVRVSTDSIFMGKFTGASSSSTHLSNSAAIGPYSKVNANDSFVLGTKVDSGSPYNPYKVGIGTDTPKERLHIVGNFRIDGGSISIPSFAANQCLQTDSNGLIITSGGSCGGSGGGSPPLEVFIGAARSSPTASITANTSQFTGSVSGSTFTFTLNSSSVTLQGNTFNAASKLVLLDSSARYPALDGSQITNLTATGIYAATATASFPFGFSVSTISVTGSGAGQLLLTEGLSTTVEGVGTGKLAIWADSIDHKFKFNPNNVSTYAVVGASTTPTPGLVPEWNSNGTLVDTDGSVVFSSMVRVGPGTTANTNTNFIVTGYSLFSDDGTAAISSTATVTIHDHLAAGDTGARIFQVGSDQLNSQFVVRDRAVTLMPQGATVGSLTIGSATNPQKIKTDQNTNEVSVWEAGNTAIHLRTSASDNGPIVLAPSFSTAVYITNAGGATFTSSATFNHANGITTRYGVTGGSVTANAGFIQLFSRTLAQLGAITPSVVGQMYYCSDCTTDGAVISTGTAQGAFGRVSAKSTAIQ